MVVKVYISGISGNKEVKKRQQRVLMILDSRNIKYEVVDIAEPDNEADKDFMQNNSTSLGATVGDANPRHALPPQLFNDTTYCGDYDQFDMANEVDELEKYLKLAPDDAAPTVTSSAEVQLDNGEAADSAKNEVAEESNEAEAVEENNEAEALVQPTDANSEVPDENGEADDGHGDVVDA
ncbi:PREDICTED: SH3 domain-binding glutamic acid-rich protein homolog [Nicrophorus vespilloides]|uniref:SH3 domain-binding glutamic acid-rich protein homolog n=1 Tax=Nicrophorus vespilloides TaxID=110193 RepID=A0ABM1MVH5_NICVS|nr:PREDICTED: SH3 domain-binding glutamic acid-rich protein homolog [Nicrophorus vespilloides]